MNSAMSWKAFSCSRMPGTVTAWRSFFDVLLVLCSRSAQAGAANVRAPAIASATTLLIYSPYSSWPRTVRGAIAAPFRNEGLASSLRPAIASRSAMTVTEQRLAVVDLGSNSFRLVVFTWVPGRWWKRTDEIHEAVRIGEGLEAAGVLAPEPMERALETTELYAHFCRATGIDDVRAVATSAIRDASNRDEFLRRAALDVQVLTTEEEAFYGYLAAINSTTLTDGVALDIGGGSMQLTRVEDRQAIDMRSWPLGAVRMTERFLAREKVKPKHLKALRAHVAESLEAAPWLDDGGALAGIGGTVRNLAAAAELHEDLPSFGVQGFPLRKEVLDELVDELADMTPAERAKVPGIKPERGDLILAGALVVQSVMAAGGFDCMEVTEAGLREGVFFASLLDGRYPPLIENVREHSVRNLAAQYHADPTHTEHVAELSLSMWDALGQRRRGGARAAVGGGDAARHRHGGRLRRPPQALALSDPERRAAGLLAARDRADRPDGALSPQG